MPSLMGKKYSILMGSIDKPLELLRQFDNPIVVYGNSTDEKTLDVSLL